jgi:hypothetical protein
LYDLSDDDQRLKTPVGSPLIPRDFRLVEFTGFFEDRMEAKATPRFSQCRLILASCCFDLLPNKLQVRGVSKIYDHNVGHARWLTVCAACVAGADRGPFVFRNAVSKISCSKSSSFSLVDEVVLAHMRVMIAFSIQF